MIKIMIAGLVALLVVCFVISGGTAWGALMFELVGAAWLLYCFSKY